MITTSPTIVLVGELSDDLLSNFSLKDYVFCSMLVKPHSHESIYGTGIVKPLGGEGEGRKGF